jgi:hypothetical protein
MAGMADDKVAGRLARQAGRFAGSHGGAEATVEYLGARGARIVLVGQDGAWGDLFAPTYEAGRAAVEAAGLTLRDGFGGEMAARVRTGPYEWKRMAGIQIGGGATP